MQKFLDEGIRHWRGFQNESFQLGFQANAHMADHYIDCLQKVKRALFGGEGT